MIQKRPLWWRIWDREEQSTDQEREQNGQIHTFELREADDWLKRRTYKIYTVTEVQTNGDPTEQGATGDDLCPDTGNVIQSHVMKLCRVRAPISCTAYWYLHYASIYQFNCYRS